MVLAAVVKCVGFVFLSCHATFSVLYSKGVVFTFGVELLETHPSVHIVSVMVRFDDLVRFRLSFLIHTRFRLLHILLRAIDYRFITLAL